MSRAASVTGRPSVQKSIRPILCYIGPKGEREAGSSRFNFTSVEAAVRNAVEPFFQFEYIDVDNVARLFGGEPNQDKDEWDSCILNCDVLVYDVTEVHTDHCRPAPPMSLAYYIGLRDPKTDDNSKLIGHRQNPISTELFIRIFRPALERHNSVPKELSSAATLYEKWAPVAVLQTGGPGSEWRICNMTTVDIDCWIVSDEDMKAKYTLSDTLILPELLDADDNGVRLKEMVLPFFQGEETIVDEINWADFQLTLKFERERTKSATGWTVAQSHNIVMAMPLTSELQMAQNARLGEQTRSQLFWNNVSVAKSNVYYRQETWGGEGAQPFKAGDFVVADVVARLENGTWPEGVREIDVFEDNFAWKRVSNGSCRITRTMTESVFSRTYRQIPRKPALVRMSSFEDYSDESQPLTRATSHLSLKRQRVQIALQGVNESGESAHPLAGYARELIRYNISGEGLDMRHFVKDFAPLLAEASLMDGMIALREMFRTKIQNAARTSAKTHAIHALDQVRMDLMEKTNGDRELVLQLIRAYAAHGEPRRAVELMEQSVKVKERGMGDYRIEIMVEGAQALKKLGSATDLIRAYEILDLCVELLPSDETFGVLGGIHKQLRRLYKDKGDHIAARAHFLYSCDAYRKGCGAAPEAYYCGINWAMLLREQIQTESDVHMQQVLSRRFQELIPRLCVALGKAEALQPTYNAKHIEEEYWRVATAVELAAQSQEWEMGRQAMMVLFSLMNEMPVDLYWMLQSTFKQQQSVLKDLKEDGIEVDEVFEWWVNFYCQTFEENQTRSTFHVLGFENKAPVTVEIKNNLFVHTRVGDPSASTVPVMQITSENAKDRRFLRLSILKGKIVVKVLQILFPNKKLCLQFNQALSDAKKLTRNPARLREAHSLNGEEDNYSDQVDIDDNTVKVTARNKKVLGEGTFANVYQTTNTKTGKQIAVKVLKSKMFGSMAALWNEVTAEVQTMSTFQHKNIVKYLGCKQGARDFYIFMEHMVGGSLQDLLRSKGALDDFAISMYTRDILSALTYLHSHNIIHRDIKAGNVLLDESLRVAKLADFGTSIKSKAKDTKPAASKEAAKGEDAPLAVGGVHGSLLGFTPPFVSPEVVVDGKISDSVDVWALGCTVIQMVTSTQNHCALHAWEHAGDQLPLHVEKDTNMLVNSGLHKAEGEPCWVCALQRGDSPGIPSYMSQPGQNFLELCLNPDPTQRASVSALEECAYISAGGGVLVDEVDEVTADEKGILWTDDGQLQCDGLTISKVCTTLLGAQLITRHTAFAIYSQAAITANCSQFEKLEQGTHLLFDIGANPSVEVLQVLASLGVHATMSSTQHLKLVTAAEFNHEACMIDGTANMEHSTLQSAINENMIFKVHSKLDLTRLREASELNHTRTAVKLLLPSESGRPEGRWFQHSLDELLGETLTCDLFQVDGVHCEVYAPDQAFVTISNELHKIKMHFPDVKLTTVCLAGLDQSRWTTPECSLLTSKLAKNSQLFLEISHDLLCNSTIVVDKVLQVSGNSITVQEGVFHPDTVAMPLRNVRRGEDQSPTPGIGFHLTSFSKHATLEPVCTGFSEMPKEGDYIVFFVKNISTCGALWSSLQQFMVNKNTKAIEKMKPIQLEHHNAQIYTAATSRMSVMRSISCTGGDLPTRLSEHDLRCSQRLDGLSMSLAERQVADSMDI